MKNVEQLNKLVYKIYKSEIHSITGGNVEGTALGDCSSAEFVLLRNMFHIGPVHSESQFGSWDSLLSFFAMAFNISTKLCFSDKVNQEQHHWYM